MVQKRKLTTAMELAANMLKKLDNKNDEWTQEDDKKLEKLTKIVGVLSKLLPLEEKGAAKKTGLNAQDRKIIKKYMERKKRK
jgi:hypothetical protein